MLEIIYKENTDDMISEFIDNEFNKYAKKNDVVCDYESFCFTAIDNGNIVGVITGHSYYSEVHISDLIVLESYRHNKLGSRLLQSVEVHFKNSGFHNINLTTYEFQALEFYKKNGYIVEFVRKNEKEPRLNKYYLVKYL